MSFMDWFWAAVAAAFGWVAAPFIFVAGLIALVVVFAIFFWVFVWLKDFCKTGYLFYRWLFTRKE